MHPVERQLATIETGDRAVLHFPSHSITFGDPDSQPVFEARIRTAHFWELLLAKGNLALGECYMTGDFEPIAGELHDFLTILLRARLDRRLESSLRVVLLALRLRLLDTIHGRKRNVRSHYDIGDDIYRSFLDSSMTYSCGYARTAGDSLEEMQVQKFDRIAAKLELAPNDVVLDIGCGYGGLVTHLARHWGTRCHGITNSRRHTELATKRASESNLDVQITCGDFSTIEGRYDKIVSVGMLEHVPRSAYGKYFRKIAEVLEPSGLCLLQFIGCSAAKNKHDPFIQKYIFPGSNQPRLSEISQCLEREGLFVLDVENLVIHYRLTVLHWLANFRCNRSLLAESGYDETFLRMWEYYFHCGIAAATASESALFQVLVGNSRQRSRLVRV
jgi:cyclopropane-fatty-acyl-phospholipid synthase